MAPANLENTTEDPKNPPSQEGKTESSSSASNEETPSIEGQPVLEESEETSNQQSAKVKAPKETLLMKWIREAFRLRTFKSTPKDLPLVQTFPSFLPEEIFQKLKEDVIQHPLIGKNPLSRGFKNTTGFMVRFNKEGLERLRKEDHFIPLLPYFDAVRTEEATCWVMNVLVCQPLNVYKPLKTKDGSPANSDALAKQLTKASCVVACHQDNTAAIKSKHQFLASQVHVLYIQVPEDIMGGSLELFGFSLHGPRSKPPLDSVNPQENMMVVFRGDSWHRVKPFVSPSGQVRVSLVVEQYNIPDSWYPKTKEFVFKDLSQEKY